jgi:RimJ/RimL family protein N-acetyltransferase
MVRPFAPEPPLSDGTIRLRPSDTGDLAGIDAGIHDAAVICWIGPPEGSAAEVLALNERRWADGSPTFAICDMDDRFLGLVWINVPQGDPAVGWVGYWLLPDARGRGCAVAAVRLIAGWAMRSLHVATLRLATEPGNERSRKVAERSGFREVAVRRASATIGDRIIDQVVYELVDAPG